MKMLTLEETIQWMDKVIFEGADWDEDFWSNYTDAIHYLKMYRSDKLQYEADRKNWTDNYAVKLGQLENATAKHMQALKELQIGMKNDPLTWEELFSLGLIGRPVWSEEKHAWFLIADSALDNRSWVDLADACGKITRLGPHDLKQVRLYKREKK